MLSFGSTKFWKSDRESGVLSSGVLRLRFFSLAFMVITAVAHRHIMCIKSYILESFRLDSVEVAYMSRHYKSSFIASPLDLGSEVQNMRRISDHVMNITESSKF
jgi:hypothetical protein